MGLNERISRRNACLAMLTAAAFFVSAVPLSAQVNERCPRLVSALPANAKPVSLRLAQQTPGAVKITFVGHSTFLIESPGGIKIATDYNDYVRPDAVPDVATMNRAHSTHYTLSPDPAIKHVLRGWGEGDQPARHEVEIGDVFIRNVPTNIRDWDGGTNYNQNSIFVFELSGLCIAHLGHLHHTLTPRHLDALGRIDVVLVPVDGSYTLNTDGMAEVLKQIDAPVAIPMHIFGEHTLARFLDKMGSLYEIKREMEASISLSRATLPQKRTMIVLPGR
ncbi:MAG: MBL fold metallo-hydrolase [Xanthobacteraceae bacterium]|nr:MBL fold metallo-hydrolase [Xanthobacteraceae bacterium]